MRGGECRPISTVCACAGETAYTNASIERKANPNFRNMARAGPSYILLETRNVRGRTLLLMEEGER